MKQTFLTLFKSLTVECYQLLSVIFHFASKHLTELPPLD